MLMREDDINSTGGRTVWDHSRPFGGTVLELIVD